MDQSIESFLHAVVRMRMQKEKKREGEQVIAVSETVSAAASAYESIRNTLEYDEEHLVRRNAIRRHLKRRWNEESTEKIAMDLLCELIWARYLPNKQMPEEMIQVIAGVLDKYRLLFDAVKDQRRRREQSYLWILDVLSTEIEYTLAPPLVDEALASLAYAELRKRMAWESQIVAEQDRDLQLFIAIHRTVLKSNIPTLRFRILTLFYPGWTKLSAADPLVKEIAGNLGTVIRSVDSQLSYKGIEGLTRLIRRHAALFHVLRDMAEDDPEAFAKALEAKDAKALDAALSKALDSRYARFQSKLQRSVFRAVLFLFLTKMILALLIEWPYEQIVLQTTNPIPLLVNIIFHPVLLGIIALTVRIPEKKNTALILEAAHGVLGLGTDFSVMFRRRRTWSTGAAGMVFQVMYALFAMLTIGVIISALHTFSFNPVSIAFFLFFLCLVMYFGFKIRGSKRDIVIVEQSNGFFGIIGDILFLPIIRAGRWISLRAPRINIFLFFFDFIIEAPFKAAIRLIESWLAFLREKKEEI